MIKLLSLFSGIGAFEKALKNINEPFDVLRYCEIDKYASKAYSLIHNIDENLNLKDVTTIDTSKLPDDIDFVTYGFPCQDISNAGKQKGFTDENGELTRSGLFFEALRIIKDTKPKIAIAENVKALVSKKFTAEFKIVLDSLNDAGYTNYWSVLNAKDYGVPQNRERVFIVSIRNDIAHGFDFPKKYELKLRLKDLLEDNVDEKYYLSDEQIKMITTSTYMQNKRRIQEKDVCDTLCARDWKDPKCVGVNRIGGLYDTEKSTHQAGSIYDKKGLAPTLDTMKGGNRQPFIVDNSPAIRKIDIPQIVKVRKYEVDKEKLVETLRKQKELCGWTNKELAAEMELPLTQVEHWFRTDEYFSVPDAEIWKDLKWLLEMDNINEFDAAIMTFEEREGVFEKANRYYHENGISPTITATSGNEKIIVDPNKNIKPKLVGGIGEKKSNNGQQYYQQNRIYDAESIAMAHPAQIPEGSYKYAVEQLSLFDDLDEESLPIKEATKKGYKEAYEGDYVNLQFPNNETRRGRVGDQIANTLQCNDANGVVIGSTQKHAAVKTDGVCTTLTEAMGKGGGHVPMYCEPKDNVKNEMIGQSGLIQPEDRKYKEHNKLRREHIEFKNDGCSHTLRSSVIPVTCVEESTKKETNILKGGKRLNETIEKNIDKFKDGQVLNIDLYNRSVNDKLSQTLTNPNHNTQRLFDGLRIRKLTPKECFRLMGFDDRDCDILVENGISNTQIYKMAGNSICVDVLEEIFVELLNQYEDVFPYEEGD